MNGEPPSVPITTLAGIASLTDLLPELPVAGPSNSGPPCPSNSYLYHATIAEEANHLLARPNDALASQLGIALGSTPVDHIMLSAKNVSAFTHQNPPPMTANASHLQAALYRRDQSMFQSLNQAQQLHVQQHWNANGAGQQQPQIDANYSPGHNFGQNSPAPSAQANYQHQQHYGYTQQQQQQYMYPGGSSHHHQQQSHHVQHHVHSTNGDMMQQQQLQQHHQQQAQYQQQQQQQATPQQAVPSQNAVEQPQMQQQVQPLKEEPVNHVQPSSQASVQAASNSTVVKDEKKNNVLKPMLMLNKLTKEDEELMQKSLKAFAKENPKRAQDLGVIGGRRKINKYSDGTATSDSDSDDNDGKPKELKSKFFRATEKERDEEKRKAKEERRKRRAEENNLDEGGVVGKRRRKEATPPPEEELKPFVPKKVTRKVERKLIPMIMKIDPNELSESGTFSRFNKSVDVIFENMEDVNMQELEAASNANDGEIELPPEILLPKYQLQDLANETAKLKSMGAMESVPVDRLVKLLTVLELNIRDGSKVVPLVNDDDDDDEQDNKMWLEMATERVMRGAEASLTVLNIMTSKKMSKRVYIEDVIDRVALFLRFQLSNTIYPSFDPVYREISKSKTGYVGSMKKKRSYAATVRDKNILALYNKVTEMTSMLAELVKIQLLTDTTVLHISTLGVAPFFVEAIPELQLAALKLVTNVFSKYEKHRKLLLDDILASIARLPSSKRSLRTYRLNSETHIQMLTALVLQLIQCVVVLPKKLALKDEKGLPQAQHNKEPDPDDLDIGSEVDRDVLINNKYSMAMATAHQFLTVFLKKCASKSDEVDYRPLFENFVQDLLTTVNTPEWPAAELLLSLLGRVLRDKFSNRSTEMTLRLSSLEYLGVVAARLRRDAVQSKLRIDYIDSIVNAIREEEEREGDADSEEEDEMEAYLNKNKPSADKQKKKKNKKKKTEAVTDEDKENERTIFLQRVLLDYLAVNSGEVDQAIMNARHFYIGQWYRDANALGKTPKAARVKKAKKKRHPDDSTEEESEEDDEAPDEENLSDSAKAELYRLREERKDFLVKKILPFGVSRGNKAQVLSTHIDHDSAGLITRYLSSKRPFFNSFNQYLTNILNVLCEQSTQIRTKALKCMTMIVTEDPDVLLRPNMQKAVQYSLNDSSTMVRESAVDLLGRFILHKQDLVTQYYKTITDRILDTGVSVRKRVIKILKDICLEFPTYNKIPEICVKMIRRINDEEGIRKLVMEVFQNMWFVPLSRRQSPEDKELLITKARNITDVVVACHDFEWFEQLLDTLFKPKEDKDDATKKNTEPPAQLVLACQQIVDCLVESVLRMEESNSDMMSSEGGQPKGASSRLVACLTTLYLFAKIRPQLLTEHVQTLAPYLAVTARTKSDNLIVSNVARTLELTVPLLKHPSEIFLSQLEEAAVKLILSNHEKKVVEACLNCLGSVVNEVTKNFKLIRDCFTQYFGWMSKFHQVHQQNPNDPRLSESLPKFRRAMFTVGLLLRHFDFSKEEIYQGLPYAEGTVEEVFRTMFYFMRHNRREIQSDALGAIGFVCVRHHNFMMESKLKSLYIDILQQPFYPEQHKIKVLNNIECFLFEEELRMIRMDKHWKDYAEKENLKEMGDVSSGMASTVIQVYLKSILEAFLHEKAECRIAALKVISIILSQGLVHPAQIVPYLICMATDSITRISHAADRDLQEIEKKYPGFIHMKLLAGIRLSFRLQQIVQGNEKLVRGYRVVNEGDLPSAMNGYLYSIMKTNKSQRRAILTHLLKQFDESSKNTLSMMLYLADNLAYIPYSVLDEPLFVIHHIDIQISVSGSNLLQTFKECLKPPPSCEQRFNLETGKTEYIYDEDLDDDEKSVFERLPDDPRPLQEAITAAQGCNLLLVLKEHLKDLYGLTAAKLSQYSPNDTSKAFDRQVSRRNNVKFNPRQTIEILKLGEPPQVLNDEQKLDLVKKYMEFKDLMNKIDPDEEEDEDGNPIPSNKPHSSYRSRAQAAQISAQQLAQQYNNNQVVMEQMNNSMTGPARSYHQPHQQAYMQYQQQHQDQLARQAASGATVPPVVLRQSSRSSSTKKSNHNDYYSTEGMVLDPETGQMVPAGDDYDDEDQGQLLNEKQPVVIKLGQLASRNAENSTQGSHRVPKLNIKLGGRIEGSNGGSSKKHHKHRKHKKKKKRHGTSDEEDDDVVELSNDSDADYRV